MQYGVTLPFDIDVHDMVELGCAAEAAGWDGVFVWDGIDGNDAWVTLTAIAMRTQRIRIGTMLTPITRRRPWKLAQETATLDRVSGGRLILPVGLGAPDSGFDTFGEVTERKVRAQRLDEGLAVLNGLWSGQPFTYHGAHFRVENATFAPTPIQSPRIPIWVVGAWPRMKSMRRVLQCDGVLPVKMNDDGSMADFTPDDLRAVRAFIAEHRADSSGFDIVMEGETPGDDPQRGVAQLQPLVEAGLTWWLENVWDTPRTQGGVEGMRRRIAQGPPPLV